MWKQARFKYNIPRSKIGGLVTGAHWPWGEGGNDRKAKTARPGYKGPLECRIMAIQAVHVCAGDSSILKRAILRLAPRRSFSTPYEFFRIVCGMGEGKAGLGGGGWEFSPITPELWRSYDRRRQNLTF